MRTALLYGSTHGRTRKVVAAVVCHLCVQPDVYDVKQLTDARRVRDYEFLLFFCPTYGDEELQTDMEAFLQRLDFGLDGKPFAICELGSYYGYDDFAFGALRILRHHLVNLGGVELASPLSLDSFPNLHWPQLMRWVSHLNIKIHEHARS